MRRRKTSREGAALIMVIWVMLALSLILSEFVFSTRVSLNAARSYKMETAGYYLALGAFYLALDEINKDYLYLLGTEDGGVHFVREGDDEEEVALTSSVRSGTLAGAGKYFYQIIDEESKMSLNDAADGKRRKLDRFFRSLGIPMGVEKDTIVDSIMDWCDKNDLHRLNGAEDDYYQSLSPPYYAKNKEFSSMEELLLVRGMTPRIFYGLGRKRRRAAVDLATVYGDRREPNYNTAPPEVLKTVLGTAKAEEVINARRDTPYKNENGKSSIFTVVAEGRPEGTEGGRRIKAVVKRAKNREGEAVILHWIDLYLRSDLEHAEG